jgi:hypothetical protein
MRFNLVDLGINCVLVALGTVATQQVVAGLIGNNFISAVVSLAAGFACWLFVSSILWRRCRRLPLLLPRCPVCRDTHRHYWSVSREWPRETVVCAKCRTVIELDIGPISDEHSTLDSIRFQLLWPYSFGGRWRRIQ